MIHGLVLLVLATKRTVKQFRDGVLKEWRSVAVRTDAKQNMVAEQIFWRELQLLERIVNIKRNILTSAMTLLSYTVTGIWQTGPHGIKETSAPFSFPGEPRYVRPRAHMVTYYGEGRVWRRPEGERERGNSRQYKIKLAKAAH